MKTRIIFLISAIMILSVCTVHAQYTVSLVGSTNPSTGQPTVYYTQWKLNGVNTSTPPVAGDWYWEAIIGVKPSLNTVIDQTNANQTTITFGNGGSGFVKLTYMTFSGTYTAQLNVTVGTGPSCTAPAVPSYTVTKGGVSTNTSCGPALFTINATPPTGLTVRWFSSATATTPLATGPSFTTPQLSASTSYYVTSYNSTTACESGKVQVPLVINAVPAIPSTTTSLTINYTKSLTLSATPGTNGNEVRWSETPGGTVIATGNGFTTPPLSDNKNYFVRTRNTTTLCESSDQQISIQYVVAQNYVIDYVPRVKSTTIVSVRKLPYDQVSKTTQYFDGLGRPFQTVVKMGSPNQQDIVQPIVYDNFGTETKNYLPFVADQNGNYKFNKGYMSASGDYIGIADTYNGVDPLVAGDSKPFAETVVEKSPLKRPIKVGSPGAAWQPSTNRVLKYDYLTNIPAEVKKWTYIAPTSASPLGLVTTGGSIGYGKSKLTVTKVSDEHDIPVFEYKDQLGRVVLKRAQVATNTFADTYYAYDNAGNLICVISPEGTKQILESATFESNDVVKEDLLAKWAFRYRYDHLNRMIMKQVPGALPVYMVYDKLDRLVMTQDGEQRTTNKWAYTKYDYLNRPVITGIYTHSGVADQTAMTGLISSVNLSETYDGTGTHGYSNIVFPTASTEILTVTYYDNYKFKSVLAAGTGFDYKSNELTGQETVEWTRIKGLVTGTRNKVLNSTVYLSTVNYYDAKYRLIQSITHNNHRTAANTDLDVVTNVYDFVQLLESRLSHTRAGATYKIKRRFVYDHAGRVLKLYHLIGTDITKEVLLYENVYNKTGQLISKKLHSRNNETAKQIVDYRYNIRGWLQKINDVETPDEADLFKMSLNYNTPSSNGGLAQFNGNISEIAWNTAGADKQSYGYSYDQLNRLTNANYFNQSRPGNNTRFNEAISQYDLNGNIQKLTRNGKKDASNFGLMDDLQYAYTGNQLTKVDDAIVKNDLEGGFKELVKTTNEYLYNNNGAMKRDDNKGLTSIIYNHLNLPQRVERSATEYIIYTYDATGRKLSQQVFGATPKTTDYIGEFIYEDNVLKFVNHDEGRVINVGSVAPEYQYHLKDHLGNVRLTFTENKTTSSYLATMETDRQATEQGIFKGYTNGVRSPMPIENHTTSGTYSQLLNGGNGSQVGLAKSLAVNVGDIVDLEVYAKYEEPAGSGNSPAGLRNALISAFGISASGPTPMDGSQALNAFNQSYPTGILAGTSGYPYEDATAPKAYLNYILFDENFVLQDFGFDQIGLNAKQVGVTPVVPHDYMNLHVKVKKKGYLYVYLSNEQAVPTNVYFDDFKINHHTSIEQFDDYYPFGLTFNSYTRENTTAQDYKYNGKELQDELNLNWLDYGARMYDPTISRWMAVDPKSELARRWSPYTYCYNNPLIFVDPDGMFGDLYNLNGQHIGNDGNDDNKVYLANTQSDQQLDQEQTQASIESGLLVTELDVRNGTPSVDLVPIGNDELNTNATLATIRESEGHGTPTGYNTQYGGKTFDSYADHPREAVTKWGKTSTAAGAYQFLAGTWDAHSSKLGLKDFSPANQDKAAIAEISMVKGAMDLVKKGDYETALPKLSGKWTSLPGGKHQWKGFSNSIFLKHRANELLGKSIVGK